MFRHFYIIIPITFFLSCAESGNNIKVSESEIKWVEASVGKELNKTEYKTWVSSEANPMLFKKTIEDAEFVFRYLPSDFLALRELGKSAGDSSLALAKEHYTDLIYFQLKIAIPEISYEPLKYQLPTGAGKLEEYNRRVKYCAFGIQKDISLITEKSDTIPCAIMLYERSFDVAPICNFQIAFDKNSIESVKGNLSFIYHDNLFNKGIIKFTFRKEDLKKVPKLNVT